jgi:glyoxylase-like metal-dependent hydrolase (beta-lactamase superfamily II)
MAKVKVLLVGYFEWIEKNVCRASSTVTLIEDDGKKMIVDTGNFIDAEKIIAALARENLKPEDIDIVVNTHQHPDHIGCNFLFKNAEWITSEDIQNGDKFTLVEDDEIILSPCVKIIRTPGHTAYDCSVLAETKDGKAAIVGDLFWKGQDDKLAFVENEKTHLANQNKILAMVDFIVPGHGDIFKVKK